MATEKPTWKTRLSGYVVWGTKYGKLAGRFVLHSSVPEVLLIASLLIARYLPNSDFSYPSEIVLPFVLLGILASAIFYAYRLLLDTPLAAHAAALPLSYGLYGFGYAFPWLRTIAHKLTAGSATAFESMLITLLVWGVTFGLLAFVLQKIITRFRPLKELPLLKIAVFAIGFIFVVQLGKLSVRLWAIQDQLNYQPTNQQLARDASRTVTDNDKPNIYYLVFDRYASNQTLTRTYGYDNSAMTNFLADQGFVTHTDAYSNYPFTTQSISSTLAMQYHAQLGAQFKDDAPGFQTAFPYRKILDKSPVTEALKQKGYTYNQVSSWWDFTRNNPSADSEPTKSFRLRVLGKHFWLTDLQRDIVNKSVLSPLLLKGLTFGHDAVVKYDHDNNPRQNFEEQLSALKDIAEASSQSTARPQQKPQFTFAHILSPHDPYVFTETGGTPNYSGDRTDDGADEAIKYTNQLTYVNARFEDLIRTLRQKDPRAAIIIQADEGPYPKEFRGTLSARHYYDPVNLKQAQMQQKFGILASYYLPGVDPETTRTQMNSSVNAFRFVLSRYLGYTLDPLPDCQFSAGNKYYMYRFQLVSGILKGMQDPEQCKEYQYVHLP